jgi:hypothetical protein
MELLHFLAMFPEGVTPNDLTILWASYLKKKKSEKGHLPNKPKESALELFNLE